jgi:virulence factor Mce-like protein
MRPARKPLPPARRPRLPALAIAALMIIVPVFVTYYAFHKRLPFASQYTDYAVVSNSVNVRTGDPVRIAGVDVGEVEGTSPDGRATKIAFSLNSSGLPIHRDATVTIRDRLFLEGSYYLDLSPGSPVAPVAPQGFTIPEANTQTPVQFFQVLSTFDAAARANLRDLLNTTDQAFSPPPGQPQPDGGGGAFKRALPQFAPLLKDVAWNSRALQGTQPGDLERLLAGSAAVFEALNQDGGGRLADLVTGLDRTSAALAAGDAALGRSVAGLDQTLRAAPAALAALDRALPSVRSLAGALTPTLRSSPPLVRSLSGVLAQVTAAVAPGVRQPLLSSLRTTLATFPDVLRKTAELFPTTRLVTECLRTHVVPLLESSVPDGKLSSAQPVWKDFVHFLPNLSAASGQFDANGPYIRTLIGAGDNSLQPGLGTLPGAGKLIGLTPGGSQIEGSSPRWLGTLTASAFHPEAPCARQPLPSLGSPAGAGGASTAAARRGGHP